MEYNIDTLLNMLSYKRPEGSVEQSHFCDRYLLPVFGEPDSHGNYCITVGDKPRLSFMAHHDTVHRVGGYQKPHVKGPIIISTSDDCLGADCTTGVWLILAMIQAGVEGTYVVHAGEEIGCIGSRAIIDDSPAWLEHTDACISFDRRGYDSIVTHQMGERTASNAFAVSLNNAIGLNMRPDPTGSYTDSNEYSFSVAECTNISVGYKGQHTTNETQDWEFALVLRDKLLSADWSRVVIERDCESAWDSYQGRSSWGADVHDIRQGSIRGDNDDEYQLQLMTDLVIDYPEDVAALLLEYGCDLSALRDELGISNF